MVKDGVVVIDVGMNRETSTVTKSGYKLYGDVDFEGVAPKASWITPVPGGVGLMTIIGLLKNTLSSANQTDTKFWKVLGIPVKILKRQSQTTLIIFHRAPSIHY
jgi:5,10-methylene-tetrahydrofolate dehydrogenase/methenyl tetrahydrofolate cyclohydrolase